MHYLDNIIFPALRKMGGQERGSPLPLEAWCITQKCTWGFVLTYHL